MKLIPYTEDRSHVPRVLEELVESGILESIVAPNIPLAVFAIDHKVGCLGLVVVVHIPPLPRLRGVLSL